MRETEIEWDRLKDTETVLETERLWERECERKKL